MAEHVGASGEALESARSVLAARDRDLADADAELADILSSAHAAAKEAIRKLEAVDAEIEAAVAQRALAAPVEGREFARFLIDKQRQISEILTTARADAAAKVVALQKLHDRYRVSATPR